MTDRDLVYRKLTSLREHTARMRRRRTDDLAAFLGDVDRQDALGMSLLVAVQDAIDIALHLASDEGWGVAASYADSFSLLSSHGVIDRELAMRLGRMAALRNRIAHGYASVDLERIWTELPAGLEALDAFSGEVAKRLESG